MYEEDDIDIDALMKHYVALKQENKQQNLELDNCRVKIRELEYKSNSKGNKGKKFKLLSKLDNIGRLETDINNFIKNNSLYKLLDLKMMLTPKEHTLFVAILGSE